MPPNPNSDKYSLSDQSVVRSATPALEMIDVERRMIPFILVSSQNDGERRVCCSDKKYIERLDPNGANLERLKTFFKDHNASTDSAIGRVENARVEDGVLKADVIFGSMPVADEIFQKYREGILSEVSIRYMIKGYDIKERDGELDLVTITDFNVLELSAVGIAFDEGAGIGRNLENQGEDMTKEQLEKLRQLETIQERNAEQELELTQLRGERLKELEAIQERNAEQQEELSNLITANSDAERKLAIYEIGAAYGADADEMKRFADEGKDVNDFTRHLLDVKRERQGQIPPGSQAPEGDMIRSMSEGLMMRIGVAVDAPTADAAKYRNMSVQNMVRSIAGLGLDASEADLVRAMTTSDFPLILANVQNKVVQDAWDKADVTFHLWTKSQELKDFKAQHAVRKLSFDSNFKKVSELGQAQFKEKGEDGYTWHLESFGAKFAFTREMLINDDLGLFIDDLNDMVEQVLVFKNRKVYELLTSAKSESPDGKKLFASDHKNTIRGELNKETLSSARTAMQRQKDKDGTKLNIKPKYLLVPPELETDAEILITSPTDVSGDNAAAINPFKGKFVTVVDSELEDANTFYIASSKRTIKTGYLKGTGGRPIIEVVNSSPVTGIEYQMVFDFGLVIEDYRGLYKVTKA